MEAFWKKITSGRWRYLSIFILWPLSKAYQFALFLRGLSFKYGISSRYKADAVVISVGNIVVGGSGKTPVVMLLANLLKQCDTAILSRGYRSIAEYDNTSFYYSETITADAVGDEPLLLSKKFPNIKFYVGANRVKSAEEAVKDGFKILLLDDGFQHHHLQRDFDVVVMDVHDVLKNDNYLPWGTLRESLYSLCRADLIILTNSDDTIDLESIKHKISKYSDSNVIVTELIAKHQILKGLKIGAFCGIAKPYNFYKKLEESGASLVETMTLSDHSNIDSNELLNFMDRCQKSGCLEVWCTEKDYIKIDKSQKYKLPIKPLEVYLEVVEGHCFLNDFLDKVQKKAK